MILEPTPRIWRFIWGSWMRHNWPKLACLTWNSLTFQLFSFLCLLPSRVVIPFRTFVLFESVKHITHCSFDVIHITITVPLISGLIAFAAMAIPEIIPPPLAGTSMASKSGTCSRNSKAMVPWDINYRKHWNIETDKYKGHYTRKCTFNLKRVHKIYYDDSKYSDTKLVYTFQMYLECLLDIVSSDYL